MTVLVERVSHDGSSGDLLQTYLIFLKLQRHLYNIVDPGSLTRDLVKSNIEAQTSLCFMLCSPFSPFVYRKKKQARHIKRLYNIKRKGMYFIYYKENPDIFVCIYFIGQNIYIAIGSPHVLPIEFHKTNCFS